MYVVERCARREPAEHVVMDAGAAVLREDVVVLTAKATGQDS